MLRLPLMRKPFLLAVALAVPALGQQAAPPDAWPLYRDAIEHIKQGDLLGKFSPSASNLEYSGYPPFSPAWEAMAKAAYDYNAPALDAVHRAAAMGVARWPATKEANDVQLKYLSGMRNVANEVADAALYDHVHGREAKAIERVRDLLHAAELLDQPKDEPLVQGLVAVGLKAITVQRIEIIAAELRLSHDTPPGPDAVAVGEIRVLIARLMALDASPSVKVAALVKNEQGLGSADKLPPESVARTDLTYKRIQMEERLAAMSLACQLFRFEKSHWPSKVEDLLPYLPAAPADAWGSIGYTLVKGGRPDGGDRPLVFSHCDANGRPLAYPTREPQFGFYTSMWIGAGKGTPPGQFRDVTLWAPAKTAPKKPLHELD